MRDQRSTDDQDNQENNTSCYFHHARVYYSFTFILCYEIRSFTFCTCINGDFDLYSVMKSEQKLARRIIKEVIRYATRNYGDFVMAQLQFEEDLSTTDCEKKVTDMINRWNK